MNFKKLNVEVFPLKGFVIFLSRFLLFPAMSRNSQLDHENKRLSLKVEEMKEICAKTSSMNVKYKMQLDGEKQTKKELFIGNAKLKKKVNELASQCYEQHEKIRVLESNLKRSTSASTSRSSSRVTIIGNVSQIIQKTDPKTSSEYLNLEARYGELEKEYEHAMAIIDELEFELDDVSEHKRHECCRPFHFYGVSAI